MIEILRAYFLLGLCYRDILRCLASMHGIVISMRTLKRLLKAESLYRRKYFTDVLDVALFIQQEVMGSGAMLGYRLMHHKCIQHGFTVSQDTVRLLLHIIDPEGIASRRRHRLVRRVYMNLGPNYLWHIDGYDKLKPYGICISGAIDGLSRYILWLEAHVSNSDPRVIAGYFMNTVRQLNGCPIRLRADKGTENAYVREMLKFLRTDHGDQFANNCYLVGSSNHNQRIEQWWEILRKTNVQYWMNMFAMLKDQGCFTGDFLDVALLQFCFMQLIQVRWVMYGCEWQCVKLNLYDLMWPLANDKS